MALSQLLRYGGKRKRQYFPEDIAGVSALTRGQASDDLDLLLGFDDAPKPSVQPRSVARGLSKRARLVAKIHAELRETEDNGKKQRDLRTSLDALRNEHARLKVCLPSPNFGQCLKRNELNCFVGRDGDS